MFLSYVTMNLKDRRYFICLYLKLVLDNQDCITVLISYGNNAVVQIRFVKKKQGNYSTYSIKYKIYSAVAETLLSNDHKGRGGGGECCFPSIGVL